MATSTASTATPTQRPGWRTGTALISSGAGPVPVVVLTVGPRPTQPAAPLMTGSVIAPVCTPHCSRIALYDPSATRAFTAPRTASLVVPAVFGIARPYGAAS